MSRQENGVTNIWQVWWLAIRPKTLPAAASGVVMGCALAWISHSFQILPALAALCVALLLQMGSNVANDVYDFERGADTSEGHGPFRVTQAGLMDPVQMKRGMWIIFSFAAFIGFYLAYLHGWLVIVLGAAAIASAIAYTGGPFPLGYYGLGDLFVFIFFGLMCVAGTYYVQTGTVSVAAWWMSVPIGLMVTDILVVNNLRDLEHDRVAHKRTLAVLIGERWTRIQYVVLMTISFLLLPVLIWSGVLPAYTLLAWLSLPLAWRSTQLVLTQHGRPLNAALAGTGQAALAFSLLFFIGVLL